jgi:hypothetical protein
MTLPSPDKCKERHDRLEETISSEIRHIREMLARIEKQVVSTNGRVSSLEKWKYGLVCSIATLAATKWPELKVLLGIIQ